MSGKDAAEKEKQCAAERKSRSATYCGGPLSIFGDGPRPNNRCAIFMGPGKVVIKDCPYPKMKLPWSDEPCVNGCVLKVLTSGICGSDLHPYRGRTAMPPNSSLGHEFTGEVVEIGAGCQTTRIGDWGFVPFNLACGSCKACIEHKPNCCEKTNNQRDEVGQAGIYGYVCGGGWQGGQAEYVFVPWADYNFVKFPNKQAAKTHLLDLTLLTDVFPTAYHGTEEALVKTGSTVFIAGAGPIGLAAVLSCNLKGASCVIISDFFPERLAMAARMGAHTIDLNNFKTNTEITEKVKEWVGKPFVDCAIECVGYEAREIGTTKNVCGAAMVTCAELVKPGGSIGVLGAFFAGDPKAPSAGEKAGFYTLPFGKMWMKAISMTLGQATPALYGHHLQCAVLHDKAPIAKLLNAKVISLDEVPKAYEDFANGAPHKFIIDPHNTLGSAFTGGMTTTAGAQPVPTAAMAARAK